MDLFYSIWTMMITSFFIQFFLMSFIMTNSFTNITFSVGKFYMSCIMALIMGLLEVGMHDYYMYNRLLVSSSYYLSLGFSLVVFLYLYRNQMYINDNDYLSEMIEHHSMALLTSEQILEKTQSEKVRKLATNIVETQQAEINDMKQLLMN
jgi:hypothetical protein